MNQHSFKSVIFILVLIAGLSSEKTVPAAYVTTFFVTKTTDTNDGTCDADCSLREAVIAANAAPGDDSITLPSGTYTLSIAGIDEDAAATGDLDITDNLTISGEDAANTIINGAGIDRVFHIVGAYNVSFSNLTISGGYYFEPMESKGGGIFIEPGGSLTLVNSTVNSNTAFYGGGIYNLSGTLAIYNSTINNNTAVNGGGINNDTGVLTLINSTVSGNNAEGGGAGICNSGTVNLNNVTITNNTGTPPYSNGGGISGNNINIKNTIIAGNTADYNPDCQGTLNSQGYNLIQDTTGCTISGDTTGNIIGISPNLGTLQNNGGSTFTHALLAGSPAIDAGNPVTPGSGDNACEATDQRGVSRPQGPRCDMGAYELVYEAQPTIQFSNSSFNVNENDGTAIISVTLSTSTTLSVTVDYATSNGTAIAGTDYITATGTLTFYPGMTYTTFTVPILDDMIFEISETITLTLSNPVSATLGLPNLATLTIIDNDSTPIIPPASMAINGPAVGIVEATYTFTATVNPVTTTLPITYLWQTTGQSPVTSTGGLSNMISFTWNTEGTQFITVTAANAGGSIIGTHIITVVEGTQTTVEPATGGSLVYTDTQGLTTTIQIPAGAVTETTILIYTAVETITAPSGLVFAGHAFDLNAYQNGVLLPGFAFLQPVTITVFYSDADITGLVENSLKLYYLDNGIWKDVAQTCTPPSDYERHPNGNWFSVPVCHLSRFALFGKEFNIVYLPHVRK